MQQRSEETRQKILQAALKLFAQSGYQAAGVAEICKEAGVSKGAFYHHFPSKQALFIQLLENWLAGLDEQLVQAIQRAGSVPEGLVEMAGLTGPVFEAANGQLPMFLEFWEQSVRDPEIWQSTIAPYRRYRQLFAGLIQQGIDQGGLQPVDSQAVARIMVALAVGMLLQAGLDPEGGSWESDTRLGMQLLMDGIKRRGQ